MLIASAELRETRTRRRSTRPDYSYMNNPESDVSVSRPDLASDHIDE